MGIASNASKAMPKLKKEKIQQILCNSVSVKLAYWGDGYDDTVFQEALAFFQLRTKSLIIFIKMHPLLK